MKPTRKSSSGRIGPSWAVVCVAALSLILAGPTEAAEVAHWKFNGNLLDSSGNGRNLSVAVGTASFTNSVPSNIGYGSALSLNGASQLTNALAAPLGVSNAYTIAFWMNAPLPAANYYPAPFALGKAGADDIEVYLQPVNLDLLAAHNRGNGGTFDATAVDHGTSNSALVSNQWLHVALTYDSSLVAAQQYKIYYNGILQTKTQNYPTTGDVAMVPVTMSSPQTISVGRVLNTTPFGANPAVTSFNGLLDDMYLFDTALDATQIQAVMNPKPQGTVVKIN